MGVTFFWLIKVCFSYLIIMREIIIWADVDLLSLTDSFKRAAMKSRKLSFSIIEIET